MTKDGLHLMLFMILKQHLNGEVVLDLKEAEKDPAQNHLFKCVLDEDSRLITLSIVDDQETIDSLIQSQQQTKH